MKRIGNDSWRRWFGLVTASVLLLALTGPGCGGDVPTNYLAQGGSSSGGLAANAGAAGQTSEGGQTAETGGGGAGGVAGSAGERSNGGNGGKGTTHHSGGTGGTGVSSGGAGGVPAVGCGNGHVDPGEECDEGDTVDGDGCSSTCQAACETCEAASEANDENCLFRGYCEDLTGQALAGEGQGVDKSELCNDLLACVRETNCAGEGVDDITQIGLTRCYCGDSAGCVTPNGECKDQIEAAAESPDFSAIAVRFDDAGYSIFPVTGILKCDAQNCAYDCFGVGSPAEGGAGP